MRSDRDKRLLPILLVLGLHGYAQSINNAGAVFYSQEFGLDDSELARAFGWIGIGSLGTLGLARLMDRLGRRRILSTAIVGLGVSALWIGVSWSFSVFLVAQALALMFSGGILATCTVMISEELSDEARAGGQAWGGILVQVGGGLAMVMIAATVAAFGSWRWAWLALAVGGIAGFAARGSLEETSLFRGASVRGEVDPARPIELLSRQYRKLTLGVLVSFACFNVTSFATLTWVLFVPESKLGLDPAAVTALVILGGAVGLVGFPLGAAAANRIGRRPTVFVAGLLFALANTAYYWVSPNFVVPPPIALCALLALGSIGSGASAVAGRTAITELFPTRIRGTLQGIVVVVASIAAVLTQFAIAGLTELFGDIRLAITALATAIIPGVLAFRFVLPETRGRELRDLDQPVSSSSE